MLRKILVANRGEIAVRIIRACAEMGIRSVAIYSEADRFALHIKKADESHYIGSEPIAGYLNIHALVDLALATGCDAIHPGYGFLSENAQFARVCQERGLVFIGPTPEVIHRMGDKTEARNAMKAAGIPVTPGAEGNLNSVKEALAAAEQIGDPVMLKATVITRRNWNAIILGLFLKLRKPLVALKFSWKNVSSILNISKCKSSRITMAM